MPRHAFIVVFAGCLATALVFAQGSYFRDAQGQWHPLSVTRTAQTMSLQLTPEVIGGGATVVVLDKPEWMVLDDLVPPIVTNLLVDGQIRTIAELDMGWIGRAPQQIVLAVADKVNPLDLTGLRVTVNDVPVPSQHLTIEPLGGTGKQARLTLRLGDLPPGRYALDLSLADYAPTRNRLQLPIRFNTAPLVSNASFEQVELDGKPTGWISGVWSSNAETQFDISVKPEGVEGEKALCITGLAGALNMVCYQGTEDLRPGTIYVFSGQYKSANGCALSVISNREGKEVDYLSQGLPAVADWTPFTWEFSLQDHDNALVIVRAGSLGESWFDALQVVPK